MLLWCLLVVVAGVASGQESSGEEDCYSSGGVAGIVIATVVVTLVMGGLAAAAIWYLWRQRAGVSGKSETGLLGGVKAPPSTDKPLEGGYAYDNPYFKDDDDATNPDAAEKGESGFQTDNGDVTHSSNNKWTNAASKPKKNRPFSSLPFHVVFNQGSKKPRAMDDTCIAKQQVERVVVPLKGHDFTGLGFNICGNMRDGIFVKDVLHRGPASESGKIRAGDRIVGVTVSFSGMVYEDALTILSYASPYDVRLEVEKVAGESVAPPPSSASPSGRRLPPSSSFRSGQRLFHPLYRSQSIDDLTQIGKDNLGPTVTGSPSSKVGTSSGPKRSQSVETATSPKSRPHLRQEAPKTPSGGKGSRKSSTSSCESTNKKTSDETPIVSPKEESEESVSHKVKSSKVEEILVKKEAPDNDRGVRFEVMKVLQTESDQLLESVSKDSSKEVEDEPDAYEMDHSKKEEFPTAPPRKSGTPGKRKAPAPPPKSSQGTTETSAIVHRAEDEEDLVPLQEGDQPPSPKRKASSLGDLTQLDEEGHKKSPSSATILERAVSLDLQQPMPVDNLGKHQKRMLRAPTFEDPEDTSEEDLGHSGEQGASLRRWDESWSKLQSIPTNSDPQITVSEPNFKHRGLWPSESDIAPVITNGHSSARDTGKEDTFDLDVCDVETNSNEPEADKMMTSTPARKVIEVDSFLKGDVDIDDIPYLGDKLPDQEPSSDGVSTMALAGSFLSGRAVTSSPSPVSVSIPIIKPNFTHYEKLPSPPPRKDSSDVKLLTSVHSVHEDVEGSFQPRPDSTPSEETKLHDLSDIRSQSSYRPVFSNKSLDESNVVFTVPMHSSSINDIPLQNEPVVEDTSVVNGSEFSSYRTAIEESSLSSSSSLFGSKKHSSGISGITLHSGVAGFAKTLIITSPDEGESLTLNDDLDSPPPQLEPPQ